VAPPPRPGAPARPAAAAPAEEKAAEPAAESDPFEAFLQSVMQEDFSDLPGVMAHYRADKGVFFTTESGGTSWKHASVRRRRAPRPPRLRSSLTHQ